MVNPHKTAQTIMPVATMRSGTISWKGLRKNPLLNNIASLYSMQLAGYLAPLVTLPYLARVLTPRHWGLVAFSQSFGLYAALVVEFGFMLSATREVARHRGDQTKLGEIFSEIIGAKAILAVSCALAASLIVAVTPSFQGHRIMMYAGSLAGIAQGANVGWFYQGLEQMRTVSVVDILGKVMFAISVFFLIHSPGDDWKVPCIQCFWYCAATILLTARVYRNFAVGKPTIKTAIGAIKRSASMFLYRGSLTLYTTANTLILGFLSTPLSVAYYAGGEKINNVLLNAGTPVTQALFPKMSYLTVNDPRAARRIARITLLTTLCVSSVLCLVTYLLAPLVVKMALGRGYEQAVPVLRVLAFAIPTVSCSVVMGCQCMLPLGMDKAFNVITIAAGIFNVTIALLVVPRYAHIGMASSIVMTELMVSTCQFIVLVKNAPDFLFDRRSILVGER
jgi:polysaccharide transporter, PST family